MKKEYLGIDLGSDNTSIYSSIMESTIYSEPTCIVLNRQTREVRETGFLASRISGKNPYNYEVVYPVKDGIIFDDDACYLYLDSIFHSLKLDKKNHIPALVFTVPSSSSIVNRKAIVNIGERLGAKEIYIESQAKIAAIGAGKNVFSPTATLLCHIGGGVTDIACLSMGEIVSSDSTFIAGNSFNEAIRRYMLQNQHLSIGLKSAEYLKMKIGNLSVNLENKLAEVKGRDTITSLPSSMIVSSGEIKNSLISLANIISLKITDVISSLPPELVADLKKNGMYLSGGGSLLAGMREYFEKSLNISVKMVDKPLEAVCEGFALYSKVINK